MTQAVYVDTSPWMGGDGSPAIIVLDDVDEVPVTSHLRMADLDGAVAHRQFTAQGKSGLILCDAQAMAMPRYLTTDEGVLRSGAAFIVLWDDAVSDVFDRVRFLLGG